MSRPDRPGHRREFRERSSVYLWVKAIVEHGAAKFIVAPTVSAGLGNMKPQPPKQPQPTNNPAWLAWAQEIQALAQTGYYYSDPSQPGNEYHRQRYQRLGEIAAEIMSQHTNLDYDSLLEIYQDQDGYATPRVDVRAAVFKDDRLLMVRERQDGGWTLPGGWADVGDQPSHSAEREVWEEAGYRVKASRLVGVYDANRQRPLHLFHAYKLLFLCELISGEPTPSLETSAVAFFAMDELPDHLSGERTTPRLLRDAFTAFQRPDTPAVFD